MKTKEKEKAQGEDGREQKRETKKRKRKGREGKRKERLKKEKVKERKRKQLRKGWRGRKGKEKGGKEKEKTPLPLPFRFSFALYPPSAPATQGEPPQTRESSSPRRRRAPRAPLRPPQGCGCVVTPKRGVTPQQRAQGSLLPPALPSRGQIPP